MADRFRPTGPRRGPRRRLPSPVLAACCAAGLTLAGCAGASTTRGLPESGGELPAFVDLPGFTFLGPGLAGAGQPPLESFAGLREKGYSTVINLRTEHEERPAGEAEAVRQAGLAYYELPVDSHNLGLYTVYRLGEILKAAPRGSVLIHCSTGNRVGALWGAYVAWERGYDSDRAVEIARASGMRTEAMERKVRQTLDIQPPE